LTVPLDRCHQDVIAREYMRSNRLGDYLLQSEDGLPYVPSRHCTFPDMSDAGQPAPLRLLNLLTETPGSLIARRL
jgi:hypothetical protein